MRSEDSVLKLKSTRNRIKPLERIASHIVKKKGKEFELKMHSIIQMRQVLT